MYVSDGKIGLNLHMRQKANNRPMRVLTGVCGLCLSCSAVASPPFSGGSATPTARTVSLASPPVARHEYMPTAFLDLRPPEVSPLAFGHESTVAHASEPFPSTTHHLGPGTPDLATGDRIQPLASGMGELNFQVMSQAAIY